MRSGTTAMTGYNHDVVLSMRSAALRLTCSSMNGAKLVLVPVHDWNRLKCPTNIRKRRNRGRSNEVFGLVEVVVVIEVDFTWSIDIAGVPGSYRRAQPRGSSS